LKRPIYGIKFLRFLRFFAANSSYLHAEIAAKKTQKAQKNSRQELGIIIRGRSILSGG
jgi:hypothetical protein